jgi:hypothetical protein
VTDVSYVMIPPISNMSITNDFNVAGQPAKELYLNAAGTGYFRAMRTPLVAGREFQWNDTAGSGKVAILNQAAAKRFFPNGNAVGQQLLDGDKNAFLFHDKTNAILIDEPIGAKPTRYAERRRMELPNSHLQVSYSAKYWQFAYNSENVVRSDQDVKTVWSVYKRGRDSALDCERS